MEAGTRKTARSVGWPSRVAIGLFVVMAAAWFTETVRTGVVAWQGDFTAFWPAPPMAVLSLLALPAVWFLLAEPARVRRHRAWWLVVGSLAVVIAVQFFTVWAWRTGGPSFVDARIVAARALGNVAVQAAFAVALLVGLRARGARPDRALWVALAAFGALALVTALPIGHYLDPSRMPPETGIAGPPEAEPGPWRGLVAEWVPRVLGWASTVALAAVFWHAHARLGHPHPRLISGLVALVTAGVIALVAAWLWASLEGTVPRVMGGPATFPVLVHLLGERLVAAGFLLGPLALVLVPARVPVEDEDPQSAPGSATT